MAEFNVIRIHEIDKNTLESKQVFSARIFATWEETNSIADHLLTQWLYKNPGKLASYSYTTAQPVRPIKG